MAREKQQKIVQKESQADAWLHEQILATQGEQGQALIQSAHAHGTRASIWLCEQMAVRGYPELIEAYQRQISDETERSQEQ